MTHNPLTSYSFFVYKGPRFNGRTEYGVAFGFGQLQVHRWGLDVCFLKDYSVWEEGYNRIWWSL